MLHHGSGISEKLIFAKEAKLLGNIVNDNIVNLIGVCEEPVAIVMEYMEFSFRPFSRSASFHNLDHVLMYMSDEDIFHHFPKLGYFMAKDISNAVDFLHSQNMVHRDIKPSNVLVSNLHYDINSVQAMVNSCPIVCKLGDLGEARSKIMQTRNLVRNSRIIDIPTKVIDRGSDAFMAPELLVEEHLLSAADIEDLKRVDIWSLLMTLFLILNPDQRYPYQSDITDNIITRDTIKRLLREKRVPSCSQIYLQSQATQYQVLRHAFYSNVTYDPTKRIMPSALRETFISELSAEIKYFPLSKSQGTALEMADQETARRVEKQGDLPSGIENIENDGTNSCAFLALGVIDKFFNRKQIDENCRTEIEDLISSFPSQFNMHRDTGKLYDIHEAINILQAADLLKHKFLLYEDFFGKKEIFSSDMFSKLQDNFKQLLKLAENTDVLQFAIFQADVYIFSLAAAPDGNLYLFETHPISKKSFGNGNGMLVVSNSCGKLIEWIILRLVNSGVSSTATPFLISVEAESYTTEIVDFEETEDGNREHDTPCPTEILDSSPCNSEIEFYHNDMCLPIFSKGDNTPIRSKMIASLIINEDIPRNKIALAPPVYVASNVSFVIDSSSLSDHRDLKMDLTQGMTRNKTKFLYFTKDPISGLKASDKNSYDYKVTRYIYSHKLHKDFHKVITTVSDNEKLLPLVFVQFYFDKDEHPIEMPKEGKKKVFYSVINDAIQLCAAGKKGKNVFHELSQKAGSFENARTVADLPSSYQQIYDVNRNNKKEDELIEMIDICNRQKFAGDAFIRDVRYAPELSIFLAFDSQLQDIYRFCANNYPFSILGVDPTFNLCNYNVTVTTYRHPLLLSEDNVHPVMLGPVLIHSHKTYDSYFTLPSNMVRFKPSLSNIFAFGTDGEINVSKSLKDCFRSAEHLRCSIHIVDNIKSKCEDLGIPSEDCLNEIMGVKSGDIKVKGLIDSTSEEEFIQKYDALKEVWLQREGKEFVDYIETNKRETFKDNMRADIRTKCGLGEPPIEYNQNANECMNSVLKKSKGAGKLSLKELCQMVQKEVMMEQEKVKLALIGRSEYRLLDKYKEEFFIDEKSFYESKDIRAKKLKSFNEFVPAVEFYPALVEAQNIDDHSVISLTSYKIPNIPPSIIEEIESDAVKLLEKEIVKWNDAVYYVYNAADPNDPYKVKLVEKDSNFSCQKRVRCERFKAFSICSHTVVVASKLKILDKYIQKVISGRKNKKVSIIDLCNASKEQSAGKKPRGTKTKRKGDPNYKAPKVLRHIDSISEQGSEEVAEDESFVPSMVARNETQVLPMRTFCLKWLGGNIKTCYGCGDIFSKPPTTDIEKLIIVYRDDKFVYGTSFLDKVQNVHFHLNPSCVWKKYPDFTPSNLLVLSYMNPNLSVEHKGYITSTFGVIFE